MRPGARAWWLLVALYVAALFAVQPWMGFAIDAFKARWGELALERTVAVVAGLSALALLAGLARSWRTATAGERALVAVGLVLYALGVLSLEIPQERLHYLEYGLLAAVVYAGLEARPRWPWWLAAGTSFLIAAALGYLDEELQGRFWERRYFDWRDVALNVRAAALGTLLAVPLVRAWRRGAARAASQETWLA